MIEAPTCIATDGDSIRCGSERIRLIGIDAPETGRCQRGRVCTPGDGQASKRALVAFIAGGRLFIERRGQDRYGRTLACVRVNGRDASAYMLRNGFAVARYRGTCS